MPTKSTYVDLDIPNVDIFTFLFERKDREYPDEKGMCIPWYMIEAVLLIGYSDLR